MNNFKDIYKNNIEELQEKWDNYVKAKHFLMSTRLTNDLIVVLKEYNKLLFCMPIIKEFLAKHDTTRLKPLENDTFGELKFIVELDFEGIRVGFDGLCAVIEYEYFTGIDVDTYIATTLEEYPKNVEEMDNVYTGHVIKRFLQQIADGLAKACIDRSIARYNN